MEDISAEAWVIIGGIITAIVTGVITYFTTKSQSRSEVQKAEVTTRGEEWKALLEQVKKHSDKQISDLREEIDVIRNHLREVKEEFRRTQDRYRDSIYHIREWRTAHPETAEKLTPPESIKDDL